MKFKNNGQDVQVKVKEKSLFGGIGCRWECVRHGEVIELDEGLGLAYGFEKINETKVTKGNIGSVKVETKQIEKQNDSGDEEEFFYELCSIKGIGTKTAEDIILMFPDREGLKNKIKTNEILPFRDDVEEKLRREYGK